MPSLQPITFLAWMMFLVPTLGVPSELMLQDTLKSALAAFGVLIAALVFFWQQRQRTAPLRWHGLVWLPLALMAYALGSMAWSHTYLAGVEAIRWFILSLLLWLVLNTLTRKNLPTLLWGIHLGAVVASLWVALQFWFDWRFFPQGAMPASSFINRNFFAEYAIAVLPLSVWLLASLRSPRLTMVMTASVAFNVVALMMTGTRSALVTLLVLLPVLAVVLVKYRDILPFWRLALVNRALTAAIFIACVGVMGSIPTQNAQLIKDGSGTTALERSFLRTASMAKRSEYTEGSFSIRSQMWMATARMMLANPLTGVGAGAWEVQIPLYQRTYTVLETDYYAHNEFLQLLSEYGMAVGGLVLAFLLAYLLHSAGTTWRLRGEDLQEAPLRAFTLTSLLALLIVSNAGFPWHLAGCGALLVLALAMLAGSDARLGKRQQFFASCLRWKPTYSRVALIAMATSLGLAAYISRQAAVAEYKIVHAIHLGLFLTQTLPASAPSMADRKSQMLQDVQEGIAINHHYRRLTAVVAEQLAASGDFRNAIKILETVAASRPNVVAIWAGLAINYAQMGQHEKAHLALQQVERLKPDDLETVTLKVTLLTKAGQAIEAAGILNKSFDLGRYDFNLLQTGYAVGLKENNPLLTIRSLELFNTKWPEQGADTYFRLGSIYANPPMQDDAKALAAFKQGYAGVPADQKDNYRYQLPLRFQQQM
ncbi:putative O-antigen polymerase [Rhodoferax antarcticus ANT.BR]|uniref:Putative O-antigen polymerase n=2 Tax=Rhodoferax antarcticus TaxID=81479 RepID=A0A1Q8YET6_9BURK|nr:putative O-antigen polymerase [Rhodoferax antarcticus ANT.BR]